MKKRNKLQKKINILKSDIEDLNKKQFSLNKIKDDDYAIKFYTGFPNYKSLITVYEYFEPKVKTMHYWQGLKSNSADVRNVSYQSSKKKINQD